MEKQTYEELKKILTREDISEMLEKTKSKRYCVQCGQRLKSGSDLMIHKTCEPAYISKCGFYFTHKIQGKYDTMTGKVEQVYDREVEQMMRQNNCQWYFC